MLVEHANVLRLFARHRARGSASARDDVWTLFHSLAFDFSVWEIWGALLHGGRLVVVPAADRPRRRRTSYALLCDERRHRAQPDARARSAS